MNGTQWQVKREVEEGKTGKGGSEDGVTFITSNVVHKWNWPSQKNMKQN
jgi:hypothetical protein